MQPIILCLSGKALRISQGTSLRYPFRTDDKAPMSLIHRSTIERAATCPTTAHEVQLIRSARRMKIFHACLQLAHQVDADLLAIEAVA